MKRGFVNVNEIAKERCDKLLALAKEGYATDKRLSIRYVALARAIAMKHRLKLGRRVFCKKCNAIFIPGVTSIIRVFVKRKEKKVTCKNCGAKIIFKIP